MKHRPVFRNVFLGFLLLLMVLLLWQYRLVEYGISQAQGQLRVVWNARPLEEYLADPAFPDSLKGKLLLIQEIRRFAVDSLGINPSDNYTTVYNQQGKPILWVVTATPPYRLEAEEWKFPLIGSFSYKGFFDYARAEREEAGLKARGLDTEIDEVSGWSTLGWFKDPILTNWLSRSEGQLANLIIHELTHGTLYVKNNVEYNENLASFVGDHGATLFLERKYGRDSEEYRRYEDGKIFREKYSQHILRGANQLERLYASFRPALPKAQKDTLKYRLIGEIMRTADTLTANGRRRKWEWEGPPPNNTYFMGFVRYRAKQNQFEEEFKTKFNSDFRKYLAYLKETYPSL
ncbi:MAG: aminopeptidase [Cytophagales bacterium]|nr:aminopeptidase [Cytophagales bacterium]